MIEEDKITQRTTARGMQVFIIIWLGQLVSLIGSGLSEFALSVWVYQQTNSATQFSLLSLSAAIPSIAISPIAGILVDRSHRRACMLLANLGESLSTGAFAILVFTDRLEIWHIYLVVAASSAASAFRLPAYIAVTRLLIPLQHLDRANGMIYLGQSAAHIFSPILAGILVVTIQIQGVVLIDLLTFLFALVTLLFVQFPETTTTDRNIASKTSSLSEVAYGWTYIKAHPGLFGLLLFKIFISFREGTVSLLATPLILSFASPAQLGTVLSIAGSGMMLGSLVMITRGRSQRVVNRTFYFTILSGLCIMAAGLQRSVDLFAFGTFVFFFSEPIINSSIQVIFQKKVAPDAQGRVFAFIEMIVISSIRLSHVVAGPLADQVFEPLMVSSGPLAGSIGQLIGVGAGRGIGFMFILIGMLTVLMVFVFCQYPRVRLIESELPDAIADTDFAIDKKQEQDLEKTD